MFTITFRFETGNPVTIDANPGEKLLDVARKANVAIDAPCSGNGVCGKCRVRLASGSLDAPINRHITQDEYDAGWRLACLATVTGDAEIEVPDIASAYRSRMKMADLSSPEEIAIFENLRKQLEDAGIAFGSDISFLSLELDEPTLDDTMPDNERLLRAVEAAAGVDESAIMLPYAVLKNLSEVLRESNFKVKCVISRDGGRILMRDVLPGDSTIPWWASRWILALPPWRGCWWTWRAGKSWPRPAAATDRSATGPTSSTALSSPASPAAGGGSRTRSSRNPSSPCSPSCTGRRASTPGVSTGWCWRATPP